ncbi:meiotic recombination protein REC114 isoform X4 [Cygnus atratus]|uniref:meiotic recombination protein REC114 isoform X4 n=1 Tax=Cygnus atratus TaxID=8868 RepID=UPI0021B7C9F8|nr:meiotic recombination protein REC114 isoform X4 [Cygnus atratus]
MAVGGGSLLGSASTWPLKRYGRFLPPTDSDEEQTASSWQVFESNEESGHLILTIVVSGHFFISQGRTVLCLKLMHQVFEMIFTTLPWEGFSLIDCHKWLKIVRRADCLLLCAKSKPDEPLPDSYTSLGERRSVTQLAQSVLKQKFELPLVYRHSVWSAQELGPFIRLCLMDQNFPAFVEDVEKELKKLAEG